MTVGLVTGPVVRPGRQTKCSIAATAGSRSRGCGSDWIFPCGKRVSVEGSGRIGLPAADILGTASLKTERINIIYAE
jgi:hypothetical protein